MIPEKPITRIERYLHEIIEQGGSVTSIVPLTVTENGEYAEEGKAYSPVTVDVPTGGGGASNIVTGTFTASEGINALDVGYTGNGYPIAAIFAVDGGLSNPDYTDWYNAVANGAVGMWSMTKSNMTSTPTYNGSYTTTDGCSVSTLRKTSDAQTYQATGGALVATFAANANPNSSPNTCIKIADKKTFNYFASTAGGLKTGITYRYWIVYSE